MENREQESKSDDYEVRYESKLMVICSILSDYTFS